MKQTPETVTIRPATIWSDMDSAVLKNSHIEETGDKES